ncbi:MAG: hypothetical protein NTX50_08995 [Candidatus Sumerlaeota bacterium]|nr:hypothetical protein [Candidatus Sumerlaeota bacterium]
MKQPNTSSSPEVAQTFATRQERLEDGKNNILRGGLCRNCCYIEECSYPHDRSLPVLFCEEFDIGRAPVEPVKQTAEQMISPGVIEDATGGLCLNCEDRPTCAFPKVEGGRWHCEEYR